MVDIGLSIVRSQKMALSQQNKSCNRLQSHNLILLETCITGGSQSARLRSKRFETERVLCTQPEVFKMPVAADESFRHVLGHEGEQAEDRERHTVTVEIAQIGGPR